MKYRTRLNQWYFHCFAYCSLINKDLFGRGQVKRKGLQIGLQSELRLVQVCHGHAIVFQGGCFGGCGDSVFPLPCDSLVLSCLLRSGRKVNEPCRGDRW